MRGLLSWFVCAGMVSIGVAVAQVNPRSYAQELAAARKSGLPTKPSDMRRPPIPEAQNAASFYRKIDAILKVKRDGANYEETRALRQPIQLTPAQMGVARKRVAERRDLLDLAHQAASRSKCDFKRNWASETHFPEYASMRTATRWLMNESGLQLREGKSLKAVKTASSGFTIAEHANEDAVFISHLVAIAVDAITLREFENILYLAGDKPGVAEAARKAVEQQWKPRSLAAAIRGELVTELSMVQKIRRGDYGPGGYQPSIEGMSDSRAAQHKPLTQAELNSVGTIADLNGAWIIHSLAGMEALADKPYPIASKRMQAIASRAETLKDPRLTMVAIITPLFGKSPDRRAMNMAEAGVIRSAAAILTWKLKHGSLPNTLQDAISPAPMDPFDLKPLRYRREGSGFTVYSVGTTGKFDGRAKDRRQYNLEAVFTYPAPKYRTEAVPAVR